ncbi:nucleolin [Sciurus carolinensis]|uniref:Nucleolin n=1 Tax=Sciurus carolinensis TaxID=30640 RepID=A0AA41STQ0_SCICA|nr:nucleolin [Sciurus carolinensis]
MMMMRGRRRRRRRKEEEEEEPVKEAPGKRKKKMAKQKAKKQKQKPRNRKNLHSNKSAPELKIGISELFAKNDLAAVDVRIGTTKKFGYVDFESVEDLQKALELTGLKLFGNEMKLEKPKGNDSKTDRDARTLLAKKLPYKVTQDEFKQVFEDAMEIRLVSKDGNSKGTAYIEFKTEADAEKTFEEKQGTEMDGRSVSLYYTGEKSQGQDYRGRKNSTWSGESKTLVLSNLFYSGTEETLQEVFEKATFIKVPQNQNGKSKCTEETLKEPLGGSVRARTVTDGETKGFFGFVDFNSEEDAKAVKEAMEDGEIGGNKFTLDWAKPKGEGGFGVVVEAEAALEAEVAAEEAEGKEETTSHKERR